MSENRNFFTFIWKIKNFNFCSSRVLIDSPLFFGHVLGGTKWRLYLFPNYSYFKGRVACYIQREVNDSGPEQFELDYELSFLAGDGSILHSEVFLERLYTNGYMDWKKALHVNKDEVFLHKKDLFMPDDALTIRCRMWNIQNSISLSERVFAETLVETQCKSFVGTIEKFSCFEQTGKYPLCIISSTKNFLSSMNLCVAADDKLAIEIELANHTSISSYKYKIFIRDIFRNKMKYGQGEFHENNQHTIPLTLSKKHLMENKRFYFPSDVLTIECKIIFPTDKVIKKIDEQEYVFDYQDTQEMISHAKKTNFSLKEQHIFDCHDKEGVTFNRRSTDVSSEEHHDRNLTTLKDDLNSLLKDSVLCDTKLKTATETFPAHIAVLSARSPVFQTMFITDMKEKTNKCVNIDDLDADTVRRMLLFMYTDTLDDLVYESAKNLYFAADKYNIVSLKHKCSNFLKQELLESNCCDVLLLADKHQDKDLKIVAQDYIAENDEAVLFSDEWKNLEKNHPQLTLEVFRAVYMKNRRSKEHALS
ncbi:Speckle-type POZ protein [Araneus ventricosus]|uniref:Speckle-type POZ protein n=1 Tax=Araneus ventricosus TaxID=182803 RepID=A0A4Y2PHU2_ARAVE|nr:Speckle-type POZ protein [Araneus ventricosus]